MYQTYTTQQKSISPTIALVRHVSREKQLTLNFPNGVNMNAVYINHFSHEIVREDQLSFKGPITIHLIASDIQNCYYLVYWSEKQCQHVCSCYDFRRSGSLHCSHTDDINQQQDKTPVQPIVETAVDEQDVPLEKLTVEHWREIMKRDKARQRKEWDMYWHEAKLLQLQSQQSPRPLQGA
jgi:hypothetical protein